jgi:AraC-like DNA-binding protein
MEMWQARCVQNYIALHLRLKIRVGALAEAAELSVFSFNRVFRAVLGTRHVSTSRVCESRALKD